MYPTQGRISSKLPITKFNEKKVATVVKEYEEEFEWRSVFLKSYYSVLLENESPAKCRVKLAKMLGITEHFWVTRFPVSIEKAEQ